MYHDNGSGGFADTQNVIEGVWDILLLVHTTLGPFGPSHGKCPGCHNNATGCCDVSFGSNWLHATRGVWPPTARAGGTTPAASSWFKVLAGNTVVAPESPLPAAAAAIVAAAGPRLPNP